MTLIDQIYLEAQRKKIPLNIHFDLTYRCHQHCLHCYLPEAWRRGEGPGPELPAPQIKAILEQLAAAKAFFLTFSGGEIFLRSDLMAILEQARSLNFSITLITSGTIEFDQDKIRTLAKLGIQALLVSMYSLDPAVHDAMTGRPGSWQKVWQTVADCRSQGLMVVFNCFATSRNYSEVLALKQFADHEGIPFRLDGRLTPRWDGQPPPPGLALTPEVMELLYREVGWGEEQDSKEGFRSVVPEPEFLDCGAASNSCYISPQGEIWPCIEVPCPCGRMNQGVEFLSLWENSPGFHKVRELQRQCPPGERFCDFFQKIGRSS